MLEPAGTFLRLPRLRPGPGALFPVDPLAAKVFTLQAAMPAMTQMAIVAKTYGADAAYAATLSLVTVLAGILVIPAYMVIVSLVI